MKVTKNNYKIKGEDAKLLYDDEVEGGGLRIELEGWPGQYIEVHDVTEDYGKPRLQIRVSGRGRSQAMLVRPQVSNSILIALEDL